MRRLIILVSILISFNFAFQPQSKAELQTAVDLWIDEKSLGFYWMAFQISHYLFFIRAAINKVLFPTLAKLDNLKDQIKLFDMRLTEVIFKKKDNKYMIIDFNNQIREADEY